MRAPLHSSTMLTNRETEVLLHLARGEDNRRIAERLDISIRTVKYHTGNIYSKIGCKSRSEAIVWTWTNILTRPVDEERPCT